MCCGSVYRTKPAPYSVSWVPISLVALVVSIFTFNFCVIWYATEHNLQIHPNHPGVQAIHHHARKKKLTHKQHDNFIRDLLDKADLTPPDGMDQDDVPTQADISSQYGSHPIMHNLESCSEFRANISPMHRMMGVAGLFNTGTNYLAALLENNCHLDKRTSFQRYYPFREQGEEIASCLSISS